LIPAVVLLSAGVVALDVGSIRNEREGRLQSLRAAGYPTTFVELAEYTKLPEGVRNAADVYKLVFDVLTELKDDPNAPLGQIPARGEPLPIETAAEMSKYLTTTDKCFALLHEAASIEHCRFDWNYADQLQPWIAHDHWSNAKSCAFLLRRRAVFHACAGDTDAAATCIRDGLRLADSMQREPGTLGHAVRIALRAVALAGLEQTLNLASYADRQLAELDEALAASSAALDLKGTMVTQQCIELERYRAIEFARRPSLLQTVRNRDFVRAVPGMRARGFVDLLDYWRAYIEATEFPVTQQLARFREIDREMASLSFLHAMVRRYWPAGVQRTVELDLRVRVHLDLARTALAVERYRLATGNVPGHLDELVPRYLEQVPIDPFDGRPIRYKHRNPGYLLYSILEDGQDNAGRTRDDVSSGEPYDWCFVVTR